MARNQAGQIVKFTANQMDFQIGDVKFWWTQIAEHFDPDVLGQIDPFFWSLMKRIEWAEIRKKSFVFTVFTPLKNRKIQHLLATKRSLQAWFSWVSVRCSFWWRIFTDSLQLSQNNSLFSVNNKQWLTDVWEWWEPGQKIVVYEGEITWN
jgi:hypothetical protein